MKDDELEEVLGYDNDINKIFSIAGTRLTLSTNYYSAKSLELASLYM